MDDFRSQFTARAVEFAPAVDASGDVSQLPVSFAKTADELGMDNLDTMELVMNIEDQFEVTLDEDLVLAANTLADL